MKKRRAARSDLAHIAPNETALIWSPTFGFRQTYPQRSKGKLSLEEAFLNVMATKLDDAEFMQQVVTNHYGQFTRH